MGYSWPNEVGNFVGMSLFAELKRRNVFRVAVAYLVFGWFVLQIGDVLFPALHLPEWVITLVAVLLAMGFIPALIVSWVYELTPEGLKRESEVDPSKSIAPQSARRLNVITVAMLALVAGLVLFDRLWPEETVGDGDSADTSSQLADQPSTADAGPHEYSIAVLAFADMSDTQDQEYFSDGISEELLNRLAKIKDFRVAGRTSSFAFKGQHDDLRAIGEKLNVATVLEGSVRKAGNQLRITAQLVNVEDGYHLWSETYDRELDNVFAIQDEIAESVVTALQLALLGTAEAIELQPQATANTGAYELYLKGRYQLYKRRPETLRQALVLFRQAIELDPDYVPAYAGLSDALMFQLYQGYVTDQTESIAEADSVLERALSLDPGNAEAQRCGAQDPPASLAARTQELMDDLVQLFAMLAPRSVATNGGYPSEPGPGRP